MSASLTDEYEWPTTSSYPKNLTCGAPVIHRQKLQIVQIKKSVKTKQKI